jgi:hypothetical protein
MPQPTKPTAIATGQTAAHPNGEPDPQPQQKQEARDANAMIAGGLGIGAFGAVAAAIGGAVCPICVVAAPALIGMGALRRWRATRVR